MDAAARRAALLQPKRVQSMSPSSLVSPPYDFEEALGVQNNRDFTSNMQYTNHHDSPDTHHTFPEGDPVLTHGGTNTAQYTPRQDTITSDALSSTDGLNTSPSPTRDSQHINSSLANIDMITDGSPLPAEDKARSTPSENGNTFKIPKYDPAKLISPKAKRTRDALEDESTNVDKPNGMEFSQHDFLTRLHGTGERTHIPHKKMKPAVADEAFDDKGKAKFNGGRSSGGDLGRYIKEKQDQGAAEAGPSAVVDLTAEDDDEVQLIHDNRIGPDPEREVCMGSISATVMAYVVPAAPKSLAKLSDKWPMSRMTLQQGTGVGFGIDAIDGRNNPFGKLDVATASTLSQLIKGSAMTKLRVTALLSERAKASGEQVGHPISKGLGCHITLYAPASSVVGFGKFLSQRQMFLSKPLHVEPGKEVINPHVPNYKVLPKGGSGIGGSGLSRSFQYGYKERTVEEIRQDVLGMFDRLVKTDERPELEADPELVMTELMSHQKQALHFLTEQETPVAEDQAPSTLWKESIKKDGTKHWYNVISGHELKRPDLSLGGIFADMMGLGKTLSILSRICASIAEARVFGESALPAELENVVERNTRATLLVCPKSVLSNWDEQITAHLNTKKIKFYIYHGPKRTQDIDELAKYDIVITAYTTVGSEHNSKSATYSAIGRLNWFRVVLDEAHMIRNQDTNVFKAACELVSKRRWAVTGTPIQNRLDDLGALVRFLKIYPFHEKGSFEKHFLSPFKMGDPQVISNLHLMVDSMTLRRSKDKIELPDRVENIVRLDFSESEYALYEAFAKDANRKLNAMVGQGRLMGKGYAHVLVNITRLRLICAHGKELLSEEDMKILAGTSWDTAIDIGVDEDLEKPAMTEDQIYDTFYLLRESNMDMCARCNDTIGKVSEGEANDYEEEAVDNDVIGFMTPCLHTICPRCIDDYKKELAPTMDNYATCPTCEQYIKAVLPPIRQSGVQADLERRQIKKLQPTKKGGIYSGPHTKVKALIADLMRFKEESQALIEIGEPPIRSVVFSGWTQYMDLIEIAMVDNDIPFVRLDGKMSVPQRSAVMNRFKTDPSILCILVSIKAGGQGLNFTAANKVFMMEPQFNPGVEMQAVDRVHRLGQKRDVVIKRFIMCNSFEEKIVELQNKKKELAQLAHQGGKGGSKEGLREKMENLRTLFR